MLELPDLPLLEIAGADAAAFAHAQFANDVLALAHARWQWNAWLSPQGRVKYFFALLRAAPERLLVLLRGGDAETLRAELSRYVLRAKVTLRACAHARVFGCETAELDGAIADHEMRDRNGMIALRLPFGTRALLVADSGADLVADDGELARWQLDDIRAGLPTLSAATQDRLLPQWLGLDRLHAFSVGKGCYPGQEIMARLHFKGGNKRGLYRIEFAADALPAPGSPLHAGDAEAGVLVNAAWAAPARAEGLAALLDTEAEKRLEGAGMREIRAIARLG